MVAPLIAAAARAAASQAVKAGAKSAAKKAASGGAKQAARNANTIRKRFEKQAESYKKAAENAKGIEKKQFEKAATRMRGKIREIDKLKNYEDESVQSQLMRELQDSRKYLKSEQRSARARGDVLGQTLLSGTNVGSRFFSMTQEIWQGAGYDNRYAAIREKFGDKSLSQILEEFEEESGIDILKGHINRKYKPKSMTQDEIDMRLAGQLFTHEQIRTSTL